MMSNFIFITPENRWFTVNRVRSIDLAVVCLGNNILLDRMLQLASKWSTCLYTG